ncbi:glycosyltransferase family 39 protein [Pyrococcus kukulkanii]|uniref:glycosyltransferase family 39 protein n=1 Tax=Pyrococcus kukulkanii TaxID=1609559 RepID=UPI0035648C5F
MKKRHLSRKIQKRLFFILFAILMVPTYVFTWNLVSGPTLNDYKGDEVWYASAVRNILHKKGIDVHYHTFINDPKNGIYGEFAGVNVVLTKDANTTNIQDLDPLIAKVAEKYKPVIKVEGIYYKSHDKFYYLVPKKYEEQFVNDIRKIKGLDAIPGFRYPDEPGIQDYYNLEHPYLAKEFMALSMILFGDRPVAWRLGSVLMYYTAMLATMYIVWKITKNYLHTFIAFLLYAIDPMMRVMGTIGMLDIYTATFMLLALIPMVKDEVKPKDYLLAGLITGLAAATKFNGIFILLPIGIYLINHYTDNAKELLKNGTITAVTTAIGFLLGNLPAITVLGFNEWWQGFLNSFGWHLSYKGPHPFDSPVWQWFFNKNPFTFYYNPRIMAQTNWFLLLLALTMAPATIWLTKKWKSIEIVPEAYLGVTLAWLLGYFIGIKTQFSYYAVTIEPLAIILFTTTLPELIRPDIKEKIMERLSEED